MRSGLVTLATAGGVLLAGCGGSGGGDSGGAPARATVQRYFAAVAAGRSAAACAELNPRSRERLAEFAKPLHATGDGCTATMRVVLGTSYGKQLARLAHPRITSLSVHGSRATAAVDGVDRPLELTQTRGSWQIEFTPSVEADKLPGGPKDGNTG